MKRNIETGVVRGEQFRGKIQTILKEQKEQFTGENNLEEKIKSAKSVKQFWNQYKQNLISN